MLFWWWWWVGAGGRVIYILADLNLGTETQLFLIGVFSDSATSTCAQKVVVT